MIGSTRQRLDVNAKLSALLAEQSDEQLVSLIGGGEAQEGWGTTRTLDVEGSKVFSKCIPLTELQAANPYATANLHSLPAFYHYGVGSAGLSPFRELEVHRKTSKWVADGDTTHFPLLYHHRILPLPEEGRRMDGDRLDRYVDFWDGDERIRTYIEARNASTHALATFAEWVPHTLQTWLGHNQHRIDDIIDQVDRAISLLQTNGIVHFDVQLTNIVTDGATMLLTDFGLALDAAFELEPEERDFLAAHHHFDRGEFLACLEIDQGDETADPIDPDYLAALTRYRPVITTMSSVFEALVAGPKGATVYDDDVLAQLLGEAGRLEVEADDP